MHATRTPAFLRTAVTALGALLLVPLLSACPKGDVGAPCNHGDVEPPQSKVVTFPALSCNDLLCVYAEQATPPTTPCTKVEDCNDDSGVVKFVCIDGGCEPSTTYVLERSMCSKTCSSDSDCQNGGITNQVLAKETNCQNGFSCVQIQKLGEFCCQKLCVCADDLSQSVVDQLAMECDDFPLDENGKPICDEMDTPTPPPADTTGA